MFHIISNPVSGRNKRANGDKTQKILDYLDANQIGYKVYRTEYNGHPKDIAINLSKEYEGGDIIVVGGDGTFNEVINGLSNLSNWNIGLIPLGSGNDLAHILNLPKEPIAALKIILKKEVKPIDYIQINDKICANVLGTGTDVDVLENFEKNTQLKGSFRYFYSLVEALSHVKWHEFDVSIDGGEFVHKKGFIVTLCNGGYFGGGINICPNANCEDHKMEFVCINQIKQSQILSYLGKLMNGKVFEFPETEHIYCTEAIFKSNEALTLQIDGNITKESNEYRCKIIVDGLKLYR